MPKTNNPRSIDDLVILHNNQHTKYTRKDIEKIYFMVRNGYSHPQIDGHINCSYKLYENTFKVWMHERNEERLRNAMIEVRRQYWESEDEMIIQPYKPEDLKGEELEILNTML